MKGTIYRCMQETVESRFGHEKWRQILRELGLPEQKMFTLGEDVDDALTGRALETACRVLGVTAEQLGDAFGLQWASVYAPEIYRTYYAQAKTAREFLLGMDKVHTQVTATVKNARPPRFTFEWRDDRTLHIKCASTRGLAFLVPGLAKGVGAHFKEKLDARMVGADRIEVRFG